MLSRRGVRLGIRQLEGSMRREASPALIDAVPALDQDSPERFASLRKPRSRAGKISAKSLALRRLRGQGPKAALASSASHWFGRATHGADKRRGVQPEKRRPEPVLAKVYGSTASSSGACAVSSTFE